MGIHLRSILDERGDTVAYNWYCSRSCYLASLDADPPTAPDSPSTSARIAGVCAGIETGGAYPCGAESDAPDFCAHCGDAIGNALTDEGYAYLAEVDWRPDLRASLVVAYPDADAIGGRKRDPSPGLSAPGSGINPYASSWRWSL